MRASGIHPRAHAQSHGKTEGRQEKRLAGYRRSFAAVALRQAFHPCRRVIHLKGVYTSRAVWAAAMCFLPLRQHVTDQKFLKC
jgi:hypothetical protein